MRINRSSVGAPQAELANRARGTTARPAPPGGAPAQPVGAVSKVDRVEISDAGRALAAKGGSDAGAPAGMSAERLAELRQRVMSGAYNSLEVVDQVARRMLDVGDI